MGSQLWAGAGSEPIAMSMACAVPIYTHDSEAHGGEGHLGLLCPLHLAPENLQAREKGREERQA